MDARDLRREVRRRRSEDLDRFANSLWRWLCATDAHQRHAYVFEESIQPTHSLWSFRDSYTPYTEDVDYVRSWLVSRWDYLTAR